MEMLSYPRHRRDLIARFDVHDSHPLCSPALHANVTGGYMDYHTILSGYEQPVILGDCCSATNESLSGINILNALAAPSLLGVLLQFRSLSIALVGDGEKGRIGVRTNHIHADELISQVQADRSHAHGAAVGSANVSFLEPDGFAELRCHKKLLLSIG